MICVKRNKNYKKRKLVFYDDKRKVCEIEPWWGWISFSKRLDDEIEHLICRRMAMENLYWLLGHDCEFKDWEHSINRWDCGKGVNGVSTDEKSIFFHEQEKEIALNSFYNVE